MQTATTALTILIAIISVYIAYRQYKNDRHRIKMDLFDRRLAVYQVILEIINEIFNLDEFETGKYFAFSKKIREVKRDCTFLFDKSIIDEIDHLNVLLNEVIAILIQMKKDGQSKYTRNDELSKAKDKLLWKSHEVDRKMIKFMKLTM